MKRLIVGCLVVFLVLGCTKNEEEKQTGSISILWAQWQPADMLQRLVLDFTDETGIKVQIVQDSWGTWQKLFFRRDGKKRQDL